MIEFDKPDSWKWELCEAAKFENGHSQAQAVCQIRKVHILHPIIHHMSIDHLQWDNYPIW